MTRIIIKDCDVTVVVMNALSGNNAFVDGNTRALRRVLAAQIRDYFNNDRVSEPEILIENESDMDLVCSSLSEDRPVSEVDAITLERRAAFLKYMFDNLAAIHPHNCFTRAIVEFHPDNSDSPPVSA